MGPSQELKLTIGYLVATGKINKHIFREIYIWLMESYRTIPTDKQVLDDTLMDWVLQNQKNQPAPATRIRSPFEPWMHAADIGISLQMMYNQEEQQTIYSLCRCMD